MLFPVQPAGSKRPLVLLHGLYGFMPYRRGRTIAEYLGPDQPVYTLEAPGFDGGRMPRPTVAEAAQDYLAELRAFGAAGPYVIAAVCEGCIFALEMARQLGAAGMLTPALMLLDPPGSPPIGVGEEKLTPAVATHFRDHARAWFVEAQQRVGELPWDMSRPEQVEQAAEVAVHVVFSLARYRPRPYLGRVDILATSERGEQICRPDWPWRTDVFNGLLTVTQLACRHQEIFATYAELVFEWLKSRLQELDEPPVASPISHKAGRVAP